MKYPQIINPKLQILNNIKITITEIQNSFGFYILKINIYLGFVAFNFEFSKS